MTETPLTIGYLFQRRVRCAHHSSKNVGKKGRSLATFASGEQLETTA